jgi:primary-amine oxidase
LFTITLLASAALFWLYAPIGAQPGANCSASFLVDETLSNGARWQFCWEHRSLDGIVLRDVYYTPPGGAGAAGAPFGPRRILAQASIAQVHVPYDDNTARFHDITDDGFGDSNLNDLAPAECPDGLLLQYAAKDVLCQQVQPRGHAFKGLGLQEQSELLSLFSVSTSGEYNYIPMWRFWDDGTIEFQMGAAGKLQRFTNDSRFGWPVRANGLRGTNHIHNYYWRLDFDLGDSGDDDIVEEFNYAPDPRPEGAREGAPTRRALGVSRLTSEAGRSIDPLALRSWRIRDGATTNAQGQPISYHLEPFDVGHRDVGPSFEPWTANDFYVTTQRDCERYGSHNPRVNGCADNLAGFVNGESLEGADLVLWYGVTFHHIARDEDEVYMHNHWSGFRLTPRDWMDANPAADVTTCAVGDVTCDTQTDAADALFMLQHDVGLRTTSDQLPLPDGALYGYSCDVSGEGSCNVIDALLTLQCSVELANMFCPAPAGMHAAQLPNAGAVPVVVTVGESTPDQSGAIRVSMHAESSNQVGALSAVLTYDAALPGAVTCTVDPGESFAVEACHVEPASGVVRFSLVSPKGVLGKMTFGEVMTTPPEGAGASPPLFTLRTFTAAAPDGTLLPIQASQENPSDQLYLPVIRR